jgi:integrase
MRGYVARKGNRWYAVVYEGIDPSTGRERRRWYPAGEERAQAEGLARQLATAETERRGNGRSQPTLAGHVARHWLPRKRRERLQAGTLERYDSLLRKHVLPDIGSIPLRSLTSDTIDTLYTRLLHEGRVDGTGGLAIKTVHEIHLIVRAVLDDAVRREVLRLNPARLATAPRFRLNRRERRMAWTANELATFLNHMDGHHHHRSFRLAAYTGMRRSELLGLRWRDIDLDRQRLTILRSVVYANGQAVETPCKTATSARTIDLDDTTTELLDHWRHDHDQQFDDDPTRSLFTKPDGRLIHPHTLSQVFSRAVRKTDLPRSASMACATPTPRC